MSDVQGAMIPTAVIVTWLRRKARAGRPITISSALALRIAAELETANGLTAIQQFSDAVRKL